MRSGSEGCSRVHHKSDTQPCHAGLTSTPCCGTEALPAAVPAWHLQGRQQQRRQQGTGELGRDGALPAGAAACCAQHASRSRQPPPGQQQRRRRADPRPPVRWLTMQAPTPRPSLRAPVPRYRAHTSAKAAPRRGPRDQRLVPAAPAIGRAGDRYSIAALRVIGAQQV